MTAGGEPAARGRPSLVTAMFIAGAAVYIQAYDAQAILPAIGGAEHVSATESVLVLSATTTGMALGVLPWAYLSDRVGRLRVIRVCLVLATVVALVTPALPGFETLLAMRLVKGVLLGGVTGLAVAFIFERVSPARAVVAAGIYISGNTVGGVLTRVLSGIIADIGGWRIALAAIAIIGLALTIVFLVATRGLDASAPLVAHVDDAPGTSFVRRLLRSGLLLCYLQGFVTLGVFNALFSVLPFELYAEFPSIGALLTSGVLGLYAVAFVSAQLGGRLAARFGPSRPVVLGYGLAFAGFALLVLPWLATLVAGVAAIVLGVFLVHPLASAETGRRLPTHRAQSTALYQISWLAGATLVSPLASWVHEVAGWLAVLAVLAGVLVLGAAAAVADRGGRRR